MAELDYSVDTETLAREIRALAENLLSELEQGDVTRAVGLVGELNQIRDRTLYNEIGKLTRSLHEAMKNLQIDSEVGASSEMASASDKLTYVLEMTDKSANRVMDLVDAGMPLAQEINSRAKDLGQQWQRVLRKEIQPSEFRALSKQIQTFLHDSEQASGQLQNQLSDIVLAQDFQDLTGQVIHKVATLAKSVEHRLLQLVVMAGQVDKITGIDHSELEKSLRQARPQDSIAAEGPQLDKTKEDVVASQDDVDDLLSSLGF